MEDCMRVCMRKVALWYTKTFKPIMTHDELEPIMAVMGFAARPAPVQESSSVAWVEYVYTASPPWVSYERSKSWSFSDSSTEAGEPAPPTSTTEPPRPKLPYPRIDGLHVYTYRAFLDAVNVYIKMYDISELFHIRGIPLHRSHDLNRKWQFMEEDSSSVFVYREGTLQPATYNLYHFDKPDDSSTNCNGYRSMAIRDKGNITTTVGCVVPLKDIIVPIL